MCEDFLISFAKFSLGKGFNGAVFDISSDNDVLPNFDEASVEGNSWYEKRL